ncbi:bifunctional nuclease domain-containing protein [Pseudonocardia artemisiae]
MAQVRITELRGGSSQVELGLTGGTVVSARPSDAVALPLHAGVGIWAEDTVLGVAEGVRTRAPRAPPRTPVRPGPPTTRSWLGFAAS